MNRLQALTARLNEQYAEGNIVEFVEFGGECSINGINRFKAAAAEVSADVIVGIGGGKPLDTAKAAANELSIPVIIVPTAASTDAPTSAMSVIYSDEGVHENFYTYDSNPNLVLVDTEIIMKAPVTLEDLGVEDKEENIKIIAEKAMHDIASEPFDLTEAMLFNAIKVASELGRVFLLHQRLHFVKLD